MVDVLFRGEWDPPTEFLECLRQLDDHGAGILIVGDVDDKAIRQSVQYLLGSVEKQRSRILSVTDGSDPADLLPPQVTPTRDDVFINEYPTARTTSCLVTDGSDGPVAPGDLLSTIREDISEAVSRMSHPTEEFEDQPRGGFYRGELRLAMTDLEPFIDDIGVDPVKSWLRNGPVAVLCQSHIRGRGHFIYRAPHDDGNVEELMADPSPFDVQIRLKKEAGVSKRQWVLPSRRFPSLDEDLVTPWMLPM